MDMESFEQNAIKRVRTISLHDFMIAQAKTMAEFTGAVSERGRDMDTMLPVILTMPALFARLAHRLFDEENDPQEAPAEVQDADRKD